MGQGEAVLLSLHPQHAQKILSGEKKLEFRRAWATRQVSLVVIYVTVPVKKIVAVARLKEVHYGSPAALWRLARTIGGGLTRQELFDYFEGRPKGFAIELASVQQFTPALDANLLLKGFRPPQSFCYLDEKTIAKLCKLVEAQRTRGRVVFVAGVHGVGKTTMCQRIPDAKDIVHKSASELIREARAAAVAGSGKAVKDIAGNQRLLVDAVQKMRASGKTLLLDGHFALLDAHGQPQPLSPEVFANLEVSAVIAIHGSASDIAKRLAQRDGAALSRKEVNALQTLELAQAEGVCRDLCIPWVEVKSFDQDEFNQKVSFFSKMHSVLTSDIG